jgi:3-oxoacyl-[acyl-carrier-protein] synthase-1
MSEKKKVYLNGFSAACAAGVTIEEIFSTLLSGKTAITMREGYIHESIIPVGKIPHQDDFYQLLIQNVETLFAKVPAINPSETMLLVGSSVGGMCRTERKFLEKGDSSTFDPLEASIYSLAETLQRAFGFKSSLSFSTACTSSSVAIDFAYDLIHNGIYRSVVVIGADELSRSAVNGFDCLGIASRDYVRSFDVDRNGINVAEGIAALAFSDTLSPDCVELLSAGVSSDAYTITHPHPEGEGAISAMSMALERAGLKPEDIDYINAHGTGTIANDQIEAGAIEKLFGSHPYVVSTKAVTGHTLGACGALEAAIGAMSILHNIIPPCVNLTTAVNATLSHPCIATEAEVTYVLSNAFGFGGGNVSILLGKVSHD